MVKNPPANAGDLIWERLKCEITALSLPRARVGSLVVRELRFCKPCCMAKKKKKKGVNVHVTWELRSAILSHIESLKISRRFLQIFLRCLLKNLANKDRYFHLSHGAGFSLTGMNLTLKFSCYPWCFLLQLVECMCFGNMIPYSRGITEDPQTQIQVLCRTGLYLRGWTNSNLAK